MVFDEEESSIDGSSMANASSRGLSQVFSESTAADDIVIKEGSHGFSGDQSLDAAGFPSRFGTEGKQVAARREAASKTPVRKNTKQNQERDSLSGQNTENKLLNIGEREEKKDDDSENSLDDFLATATARTEDSEPANQERMVSEENNNDEGGKKSNDSELPLDAPGVTAMKATKQKGQPSSTRREKASLKSKERKQEKVKSKKQLSSKRRKKKMPDVMKTEDEDSIRSEGSGYSMPSDSGTEDERIPKTLTQETDGTLDRVGSMDSRSDSDGSTEGSYSDDEGSTDGEGTYESRESRSAYSKEEEFDAADDESTTENPESASQQRSKERQLLTNGSDLKEIELGEEALIRHSPTDLSAAIRRNTYLQKLILNQKNCDPVSFEILLEGLDRNSSLIHLELLRVDITKETAIELASALTRNTSLKKFCMTKCKFVDSGLAVLFMGLQHNKSIRHLAIESCNLSGHRSNIIAAAVPLMRLQSVRLQKTNIPDKGMRFFLHNVGKTPSLESINLSEEMVSESSMEKLVESIQKCNLVRLILSDCGLNETSIEVLAEGVEKMEKLEAINVSKNRFGDEGADILIDLLKCNSAIKYLKCDSCSISRHEKRLLKDALRYNNTFLKSLFSPEVTLSILDSVALFDQSPSKRP
jgi:Ran GTPase-activating protein (RanGAP) involved in mRNA processing and transport